MQSSIDSLEVGPIFRQGQVVWTQFPLTDKIEKYKKRPALIISNVLSNEIDQDYIVIPITKKVRNEPFSILIEPEDVSGSLPISSELRCNKPFTVREPLIHEIIGVLNEDKIALAIKLVGEAVQIQQTVNFTSQKS